ncbi:MAG: hypothetical protein V3T77_00020 [Planctomycetota bacterium]
MTDQHKRKKKLPKPALQLKIVMIFLCLGLSCVLLQFTMFSRTISEMALQVPGEGMSLSGKVFDILWRDLFIALALLIPLTVSVGIIVTFRIAGPVYRFESYLRSIAGGENPGPCSIRRGDELQELCTAINLAVDALRQQNETHEFEAPDPPKETSETTT